MNIKLSSFHSYLHESVDFFKRSNDFIKSVENELNESITISSLEDYDCDLKLIFIESGGSEGFFLENFDKLQEPYYFITSGENNSLAATLEIMTFLSNRKLKGECLHGSSKYIAKRIKELALISKVKKELSKVRLGVVGKPSDWLISSIPSYSEVKEKLGVELVDVSLSEVIDNFNKVSVPTVKYHAPFDKFEEEKGLKVYQTLLDIKDKYNLDGLTIRCFDLLTSIHSTGCLGLAFLNTNGIIGTCEGDVMAMLSMKLAKVISNQSSFQCNPSRIDVENNNIVLAHCTIPFDMLDSFVYKTHFESQSGCAVKGELKTIPCTVLRLSSNLKDYFVSRGQILENLNEDNLCRTQINVHLEEDVTRLFKNPCGNHHIVFYGDYKDEIDLVLKELLK